jgi:hypothetical protein
MSTTQGRDRALAVIAALAPRGAEVAWSTPLADDEARWFVDAVEARLVVFRTCSPGCGRLTRRGAEGPDEFLTPSGRLRHLFSKPDGPVTTLNREYIAHIAALGYAVLAQGYPIAGAAFSDYRTFARNAVIRRAGSSYELDLEFVVDGVRLLHGEAKTRPAEVERMAREIERVATLDRLPTSTIKEVEYVLDLAPRYLWIMGPGSIDPPRHVFAVHQSEGRVSFGRFAGLPAPGTQTLSGSRVE